MHVLRFGWRGCGVHNVDKWDQCTWSRWSWRLPEMFGPDAKTASEVLSSHRVQTGGGVSHTGSSWSSVRPVNLLSDVAVLPSLNTPHSSSVLSKTSRVWPLNILHLIFNIFKILQRGHNVRYFGRNKKNVIFCWLHVAQCNCTPRCSEGKNRHRCEILVDFMILNKSPHKSFVRAIFWAKGKICFQFWSSKCMKGWLAA